MSYLEMVRGFEQESELKRLYKASINRFSDNWIAGTYDLLGLENPNLMAKIDSARNALDEIWIQARTGTTNIQDFKHTLEVWIQLNEEAFKHGKN